MKKVEFLLSGQGHGQTFPYEEKIYTAQTQYQLIELYRIPPLGLTLALDNIVQLTALDDAAYHETMVHPAAKICQNPKRALVIGGGDGCLARELLRYQEMHIDMVEIDSHVIEFSKSYLRDLNQGSLEDSRVNLVIDDACRWILNCDTKYDLIYLDITDPGMDSPSESMLNEEVISKIISSLKISGVLVTQADNSQICPEQTEAWVKLFKHHKLNVKTLTFPAISYGGSLSFAMACRDKIDMRNIDFSNLNLRWLNSKKLSSIINIYGE